MGQIDSAGNGVTLDVQLRKRTATVSGVLDTLVQSATQISRTADYLLNATQSTTAIASPAPILADETYYFLVTGTTGATTSISLQGIALSFTKY